MLNCASKRLFQCIFLNQICLEVHPPIHFLSHGQQLKDACLYSVPLPSRALHLYSNTLLKKLIAVVCTNHWQLSLHHSNNCICLELFKTHSYKVSHSWDKNTLKMSVNICTCKQSQAHGLSFISAWTLLYKHNRRTKGQR